jgi:TolC family type I secretion outer membrane protein
LPQGVAAKPRQRYANNGNRHLACPLEEHVKTICSAALAAAFWLAAAPVAMADDLTSALVQAYLGNSTLAAQRSSLRATDELVPEALSGYRPEVFVTGETSTTRGNATIASSGGDTQDVNRTTSSVRLQVQQNLYAGGGTVASVSRAENLVRAGRADLAAQEQSVLLDAVRAFTAAWRDRAVLGEALNNEERLGRQLQATRDRFEVGEVARTDVAQAEARLARAQADVEAAKAAVAQSDALYRRVIGHLPGELVQPVPLRQVPVSLDEALALADINPEIVSATFTAAAAKDDVDVEFASLLPSVDLQASAGYTDNPSAAFESQRSATIGLTVTIPLYQGGAEYARVRRSRHTLRQRRQELESAFRSVQESVASAWDTLLSAAAQVPAFRSEVRANEIALEGVNQEALVGTRTVLDVLDAEQELFTSRVNLVRAQADEVFASYQLKSAVGQLTVTGLGLPVEPYDPLVHYRDNRDRLWGVSTSD